MKSSAPLFGLLLAGCLIAAACTADTVALDTSDEVKSINSSTEQDVQAIAPSTLGFAKTETTGTQETAKQTSQSVKAKATTTLRRATSTTVPATTTTTVGTTSSVVVQAVEPQSAGAAATSESSYATVGAIKLFHPANWVETIGFHQSSHEGAQEQVATDAAIAPFVLPSRGRIAGPMSAADVVVKPDARIIAPVTGQVTRAENYTLYCKHTDAVIEIAPAANPNWRVKVLHISGLSVGVGDQVVGGITEIAARPTELPFDSQVDRHSALSAVRHVHIEVVDPSIPNVVKPGTEC